MIEIEMTEQRIIGSISQPPDFTNSNTSHLFYVICYMRARARAVAYITLN
jgi:hypothetical protein